MLASCHSDGLSVQNTRAFSNTSPVHPVRACTTQSNDVAGLGGYCSPSPALHIGKTTNTTAVTEEGPPKMQPQHPSGHEVSLAIRSAAQTYTHPHVMPAGPYPQATWPTPPADDMDDYPYAVSPPTYCGVQTAHSSSAHSSAMASPKSWPSPDRGHGQIQTQPHAAYHQSVWKQAEQLPPYGIRMCTPLSTAADDQFTSYPSPQITGSSYSSPNFAANIERDNVDMAPGDDKIESGSLVGSEPSLVPDLPESTFVAHDGLPFAQLGEPDDSYCLGPNDSLSIRLKVEDDDYVSDEENKGDEPYNQLLFKAFLSREADGYAMTLQEIYQWFRDNTEKGKAGNKGWQNSVRHNLSMNKAFIKQERKPDQRDAAGSGKSKSKGNVWVLAEGALHEGVESTTRFRKDILSRRSGRAVARSHRVSSQPLSTRAQAGRKGGKQASITKARTRRSSRQRANSRYESAVSSMHEVKLDGCYSDGSNSYGPFYGNTNPVQLNHGPNMMEYARSANEQPGTPPTAIVGDVLFAEAAPSHYYANYGQQVHQGSHHQQHMGLYSLEDVTGVYQAPNLMHGANGTASAVMTATSGSVDIHDHLHHSSQHHPIAPAAYGELFADQLSPEEVASVAWGSAGSPYQA